jgi:Rrf2 family iron-sulfur cluster assembly transcriptional regulator
MKLNTRGRYGVRLMTELARQESAETPVGLRSVAGRTGLPVRYLEQIVRPLRRSGLIRSRTGRTGGYCLSRPASEIALKDVFAAATGPLRLIGCVDDPAMCGRAADCTTREVWTALTNDLRAVLTRYTLADLAGSGTEPCADRVGPSRRRTAKRRSKSVRASK